MFKKKKASEPAEQVPKAKKPIFKKVWFWVLVLAVIGAAFGGGGTTEETAVENEDASQVQEQESATTEDVVVDAEAIKEDAKAKDVDIYGAVLSAETKFSGMLDVMDTGSMLDVYDACKDTKDFAQDCWSFVSDCRDDLNDEYVDACQDYFIQIKIIADYVMDYIDDEKMEDLSKAKDGIEAMNAYIMNIVAQRLEYLAEAGFTDEEIAEMTAG